MGVSSNNDPTETLFLLSSPNFDKGELVRERKDGIPGAWSSLILFGLSLNDWISLGKSCGLREISAPPLTCEMDPNDRVLLNDEISESDDLAENIEL